MHPINSNSAEPVPVSPMAPNQVPQGQWSTGLWDCCEDRSNCFITCFCPCITLGRIAEIIDRGTPSCRVSGLIYYALSSGGCGWLFAGTYRSKLRQLFSLPEAPCGDFLVHCCCCVCALSQEYRELNNRGADPSIGWQGNVEKWDRAGLLVPPIAAPAMTRF